MLSIKPVESIRLQTHFYSSVTLRGQPFLNSREKEYGKICLGAEFGTGVLPVKPSSNHQMQDGPDILIETHGDPLAEAPQVPHRMSVHFLGIRLNCLEQNMGS